ncbi:thioredoxin [Halopenitus persicus]|uniref:Thioredoxin n=1 Tax=Halopenitus persicus TaxID=1048396 RepID=A0A1H3JS17_9EURY|nr:thioredoxin [Halopenitus persicus]SDY42054.1 thioredoxin [Halopenitus persicus]
MSDPAGESTGSTGDELEAIRERKLAKLREKAAEGTLGTDADEGDDAGNGAGSPDEPIHYEGGSFEEALAGHDLVLVDFHADWCGPCKMLEPILEDVAATTSATVLKVDADVHQGLTSQYGVRGLPTLLLFRGGEPVERLVGAQNEERLRSVIDRHAS